MRDSKVCSVNLRHQGNKDNGFLVREFPVRPLNEGQYVMDYDMPELVVFIYEDYHEQFVKDICIDRVDSRTGTMETASSSSNGSEFASPHPCIKDITKTCDFRNLMMEGEVELGAGDGNSIDHPTKKGTSEALGEIFKNEDFSRSFSFKHWQTNSLLGRIGSRVEFPHCADPQPFSKSTSVSKPQMMNSPSLTPQTDYPEETSWAVGPPCSPTSDTTKSERASVQSIDSISSTNSFSFPILTPEWEGSPVRMVEADTGQSRKHQWRKMCCFPSF